MADVIGFPPKKLEDEYIFVCRCGCTTFQLGGKGEVECADCGHDVGETYGEYQPGWRKKLDPPPTGEEPVAGDSKTIRHTSNEELLRYRVSKRIDEWAKDGTLIMAVGYNVNSGTVHWTGVETEEGRQWCIRRLDEMKDWLYTFDLKPAGVEELEEPKPIPAQLKDIPDGTE